VNAGTAAENRTALPRRPRLRTLVFGLLLALVSVSVVVSESTGDSLDGATIAIAALLGSGVILLVGAVGASLRQP